MRLFIAIWLSEETRKALIEGQKFLLNLFPEARPVKPDNLHLTLKFIGELPGEEVERLSSVLEAQARLFPPFPLVVRGAGVFPERGPARLLWVGADGLGWPEKINHNLRGALEKFGVNSGDKFKEHITLVRFRSSPAASTLVKLIGQWREKVFGETEVREMALVESQLTPG